MSKEKKLSKKKKSEKRRPAFDVHREAIKSLWGIALIIFFSLAILSFVGKAGAAGRVFKDLADTIFGFGMFAIPFLFLIGSAILFSSWKRNSYVPLGIGGFLFFSGLLGLFHVLGGEGLMRGGYWGYAISLPFIIPLGKIAAIVIFLGFIAAAIIISLDVKIGKIVSRIRERNARAVHGDGKTEEKAPSVAGGSEVLSVGKVTVKTWQDAETPQTNRESRREGARDEKKKEELKVDFEPTVRLPESHFRLPPADLLEKDTGRPSSGDIVANANIIKRTLQNFGIEVEMGEVNVGPTVTQFTLKPAEGVKLAKILALHNDLSLALAAHPIRIEAPIPGRSLVGIEIPNRGITLVRLKNLLDGPGFRNRTSNLIVTLGRDVTGAGIYANLGKMPHLLIAGSTGSGKTVCLNTLIVSLLYQNSPSMLKLLLIDPKRVEFPIFSDVPHLLAPVVVDTQKTVNALKWAVLEMDRRFVLLSQVKVRDIGSFNASKRVVEEHGLLPYIVVVIDELADLMASRGKEIEALIVRLAQMARAVGIHLVLATQRPSVEVITGLIKANITSRIAFQVASQVDSRTVLDMAGAEKLLGNGDMLYLSGDASKPKRVQGAYVTEKEVRRVADYLCEESAKVEENGEEKAQILDFQPSLASATADGQLDFDGGVSGSDDELYEEAKKLVIQAQKASASLLQRRLRVGYARAARLLDILEEDGVVGPGEGAKPREVYLPREEA